MSGVTRKSLAHVLSIIGEAGQDGFRYDDGPDAISGAIYESTKRRWMVASSPTFTWQEFSFHLSYAAKSGFIEADKDLNRIANGEILSRQATLSLTLQGWEHIETYDVPLLEKAFANIKENVPTILVSLMLTILTALILRELGQ